jgi:hypothetical protein
MTQAVGACHRSGAAAAEKFVRLRRLFGISEDLVQAIDIQRPINIDSFPQVVCSGGIPERLARITWVVEGSFGESTSPRQTARKTSEIGNYSMDRNEVVAVPEVMRWKINLGFNILTVVTLLACEGCGSLV